MAAQGYNATRKRPPGPRTVAAVLLGALRPGREGVRRLQLRPAEHGAQRRFVVAAAALSLVRQAPPAAAGREDLVVFAV